MNIQHSTRSDEWFTPMWVMDNVREVLGEIDFDPASCLEANRFVQARTFCGENGLESYWPVKDGSVYLNPPGGKIGNKSQACLFWQKLLTYQDSFNQAIFMAFSVEALQNTQGKGCKSIGEFSFCVPKKRIQFEGQGKKAPSHSNVIVYVPGKINLKDKFKNVFKDVGIICNA